MKPYPLSYFSSIVTARQILVGRIGSKIWQKILTTFFLISLLIIPSSLQTARLETYPLDTLVEGIFDPLTPEVMADFQSAQIIDGQLVYEGPNHEQVYASEDSQERTGFSYQFAKEKLVIRKDADVLAELSYQAISSSDFPSKESLSAAISRTWFQENRIAVSLLLIGVSGLLLATNFLLLMVGASLILWLISRTKFFDFKSFGEAYQFSLNCLGLPTLLACLFGLFQQPIQTVILVQNTVFALVLVWVFYKTRFRDAA